jgi:hypothetical protein
MDPVKREGEKMRRDKKGKDKFLMRQDENTGNLFPS